MSWWETLHLVTWWKRLGISAIKTGQDAPSWIWCTERLSFFGGGHIVLQRFVHVRCHFQPLPTKLVFAYFDRGSHEFWDETRFNTLPETNGKTHLKTGRNPKGNEKVFQPSIFRCENVSFREGNSPSQPWSASVSLVVDPIPIGWKEIYVGRDMMPKVPLDPKTMKHEGFIT